MQRLAIKLLVFYQRYLSFDTGIGKYFSLGGSACCYSPTCSEYTKQAIQKYGILKGVSLGARRILSCHPFSRGGWDPVK